MRYRSACVPGACDPHPGKSRAISLAGKVLVQKPTSITSLIEVSQEWREHQAAFTNLVNEKGLWVKERLALTTDLASSPALLRLLAMDPMYSARLAVAGNKNTPMETLHMLSTNADWQGFLDRDLYYRFEERNWFWYFGTINFAAPDRQAFPDWLGDITSEVSEAAIDNLNSAH